MGLTRNSNYYVLRAVHLQLEMILIGRLYSLYMTLKWSQSTLIRAKS